MDTPIAKGNSGCGDMGNANSAPSVLNDLIVQERMELSDRELVKSFASKPTWKKLAQADKLDTEAVLKFR